MLLVIVQNIILLILKMADLETFHIYPINWKCFQISTTHFELLSEKYPAVKRTDVTGAPCIIMYYECVSHGQIHLL